MSAPVTQIAIVLYPGLTALDAIGPYEVLRLLTDWLRKVHQTTRWTTSVCTGAMILAAAGILDGLPATTHRLVQPGLAAMGATPRRGQGEQDSGRQRQQAGPEDRAQPLRDPRGPGDRLAARSTPSASAGVAVNGAAVVAGCGS